MYAQLSTLYPQAKFLKVDIDEPELERTVINNGIASVVRALLKCIPGCIAYLCPDPGLQWEIGGLIGLADLQQLSSQHRKRMMSVCPAAHICFYQGWRGESQVQRRGCGKAEGVFGQAGLSQAADTL